MLSVLDDRWHSHDGRLIIVVGREVLVFLRLDCIVIRLFSYYFRYPAAFTIWKTIGLYQIKERKKYNKR